MTFQTGDVVRLRSGGPEMTVSKLTDVGIVCRWFPRNEDVKTAIECFDPAAVTLLRRAEGENKTEDAQSHAAAVVYPIGTRGTLRVKHERWPDDLRFRLDGQPVTITAYEPTCFTTPSYELRGQGVIVTAGVDEFEPESIT